jgi:hypothetical protein
MNVGAHGEGGLGWWHGLLGGSKSVVNWEISGDSLVLWWENPWSMLGLGIFEVLQRVLDVMVLSEVWHFVVNWIWTTLLLWLGAA